MIRVDKGCDLSNLSERSSSRKCEVFDSVRQRGTQSAASLLLQLSWKKGSENKARLERGRNSQLTLGPLLRFLISSRNRPSEQSKSVQKGSELSVRSSRLFCLVSSWPPLPPASFELQSLQKHFGSLLQAANGRYKHATVGHCHYFTHHHHLFSPTLLLLSQRPVTFTSTYQQHLFEARPLLFVRFISSLLHKESCSLKRLSTSEPVFITDKYRFQTSCRGASLESSFEPPT